MKTTASIVLYNPNYIEVLRCINDLEASGLIDFLFIIDNSINHNNNYLKNLKIQNKYVHNPSNPGYGASHNIALKYAIKNNIKYHIVLNSDIYFEKNNILILHQYMNLNINVGLVSPKVLYPNGDLQYLCRFLPTPFDLFIRRFFPLEFYKKKKHFYEMRNTGYKYEIDVPFLSGCFMFLRVESLKDVGIFDERFFIYAEDIDLSRRIHERYRTVFYPKAIIYHKHGAESRKSVKLLIIHFINLVRYFNKWGWIFDKSRKKINAFTLENISVLIQSEKILTDDNEL